MQKRIGIIVLFIGLLLMASVSIAIAQDESRLEQEAVRGLDEAIVEVVEYGAYGCSECRSVYQTTPPGPRLDRYQGAIRYVFRNIPGEHPNDLLAAEAAQCALDQSDGAFWMLHDALFMSSDTEFEAFAAIDDYVNIATSAGLDSSTLQSCLTEGRHQETVAFWAEQAQQLDIPPGLTYVVNGTPLDAEVDLDTAIVEVATERVSREAKQGRTDDDAPLQIVEYGAYGCHACRFVHGENIVQDVMAQYGDEVQFVFRNFPFLSPHDPLAAQAAQCAFDQGPDAFWAFHDALLDLSDQEYAGTNLPEQYVALAAEVGLDSGAVESCLANNKHEITMVLWAQHGQEIGIAGTPTFFLNGTQVNPLQLEEIISSQLAQ